MQRLAPHTTISSRWYLDPEMWALEREKIFRRTWQWVGRSEAVQAPGDYFVRDVVGEPLLVARGLDNELRTLSNVCRHRAGPVARGSGNCKQLQCGYHGWTYGFDGKLRRAPEMEGAEGFEPDDVRLPEFATAEWNPFVFARLEPGAPDLSEVLGDIPSEVARAGFPLESMRFVERREYLIDANWKVYVDNYLEGYHIPFIHPGLFREIDYEGYRVDTYRYYSSQHAPLRAATGSKRRYAPESDGDRALYYWLFPNLMLNFYPENLQLNAVVPLSHDRTLTIFEWYRKPDSPLEKIADAIAFGEEVQQEDMSICREVQKGLASSAYDTGPLSPKRENGVRHFHLLLHKLLTR